MSDDIDEAALSRLLAKFDCHSKRVRHCCSIAPSAPVVKIVAGLVTVYQCNVKQRPPEKMTIQIEGPIVRSHRHDRTVLFLTHTTLRRAAFAKFKMTAPCASPFT